MESSSTFALFYLTDMSQQAANLHTLGPFVVAKKMVESREIEPLSPREDWEPPKPIHINAGN